MQIGLIGLETGSALALDLKSKGYDVVAYDDHKAFRETMAPTGIQTAPSLEDFTLALKSKRVIWLMIPSEHQREETLQELKFRLSVSDILIDGGNSFHGDTFRRAKEMEALQVDYLDCGFFTTESLHATIGGNRFAFNYCENIFRDITSPDGYLHCGTSGAGHFVKMILNNTDHLQDIEALLKGNYNINAEKILQGIRHWTLGIGG